MDHRDDVVTLTLQGVARSTREATQDDIPLVDHEAVRDTVRLQRARRKARIEHRKRTRRAGLRFWVVLVLLVVAGVVLSITIWNEIQNLFGL